MTMCRKVICVLTCLCAIFTLSQPVSLAANGESLSTWLSFGKSDGVYAKVNTDKKVIALTFDDGPHPKLTPQILEILDKYDAKATFFVVGKMAQSYPTVLKQIAQRGHEIGNHTFSHLSETPNNVEMLRNEIIKTEDTVFKLCAKKTFLFRPPTGYCCKNAVNMTKELGYTTVVWDIDTRDWAHSSPQKILQNVKKFASNGSIILFHDFIGSNSPTPAALELVIPWLKAQGYSFITVGEMIGLECSS